MQREPVSQLGYGKLSAELKDLKDDQRPAIVIEVNTARSHGDLKESAEYHTTREKQTLMESRIAEFSSLIAGVQTIDPSSYEHGSVKFRSSAVTMDLDTEKENKYTLVGTCGGDPDKSYISIALPITKAMLGKKEGDESKVRLPKREDEFGVISISHEPLKF